MLSSLPESLDETYERMLCNIKFFLIEDARRILTLLCYAPRPLSVQELIDAVAVEINKPTGLNRKRRLQDSNGIRDICGGLIDIGLSADHMTENHIKKKLTPTVRIAHFSVQEYLESERIQHQKAAMFSLTSATAHTEIAKICLIYLLDDSLSRSKLDQKILEEYPLARFAAECWYYHYQNTARSAPGPHDCILRLFQSQNSFANWVRLYDSDGFDHSMRLGRSLHGILSPIYYASLLGLDQTLHILLATKQVESIRTPGLLHTSTSKLPNLVNAQAGYYGSPLQAASYQGHDNVVQILLDKGADVNARAGHYGNPLQAASYQGHDNVVQILLDKGADVNARAGHYGNPLQAASYQGHDNVVQILLDKGADVNAQGGTFGNALYAASSKGHDHVVTMLLEKGADVNAQNEDRHNALHAASYGGHDHVVQVLLDRGAELEDTHLYAELNWALSRGHEKISKMLLDKIVNTDGLDNAWRAAFSSGDDLMLRLLRDHDPVFGRSIDHGSDLRQADHSVYATFGGARKTEAWFSERRD